MIIGAFSIKGLISSALPISRGGYFVQCYFMLMLLSPILNSFIKDCKRGSLLCLALLLVFIEFYFDGIREIEYFGIRNGYSVAHFCLMYLIGRIIFLYKDELTRIKKLYWVCGYILCSIFTALLYLLKVSFAFDYSSPFVISASVCSFIPFLYNAFVNRKINWIAKGTFAVYILQVTDPLYSFLVKLDNALLIEFPYGKYLLCAGMIIILFFGACILYDKFREYVTSLFSDSLYNTLRNFCVVSTSKLANYLKTSGQ